MSNKEKKIFQYATFTSLSGKSNYITKLNDLHKELKNLSQDKKERPRELEKIANYLISPKLMKNNDKEIKVLVGCCLVDILRVFAPEAPFAEPDMLMVFELLVNLIGDLGIHNTETPTGSKLFFILDSLATVKSCVVPVLLIQSEISGAKEIVISMFETIFRTISSEHNSEVFIKMLEILQSCIQESEEIDQDILDVLLSPLLPSFKASNPIAYKLAVNCLRRTSDMMSNPISSFINALLVDTTNFNRRQEARDSELADHLYPLIYELHLVHPPFLEKVIPEFCLQLQVEEEEVRLKAVKLLGALFSSPQTNYFCIEFKNNFEEFLGRFLDISSSIRKEMVEIGSLILVRRPSLRSRIEACLACRLRDGDLDVRSTALSHLLEILIHHPLLLSPETCKELAQRAVDRKVEIRTTALHGMAKAYSKHISSALPPYELLFSTGSSVETGLMGRLRELSPSLFLEEDGKEGGVVERLSRVPGMVVDCWGYPEPQTKHLVVQVLQELLLPRNKPQEQENEGEEQPEKKENSTTGRGGRRFSALLFLLLSLSERQVSVLPSILSLQHKVRSELWSFLRARKALVTGHSHQPSTFFKPSNSKSKENGANPAFLEHLDAQFLASRRSLASVLPLPPSLTIEKAIELLGKLHKMKDRTIFSLLDQFARPVASPPDQGISDFLSLRKDLLSRVASSPSTPSKSTSRESIGEGKDSLQDLCALLINFSGSLLLTGEFVQTILLGVEDRKELSAPNSEGAKVVPAGPRIEEVDPKKDKEPSKSSKSKKNENKKSRSPFEGDERVPKPIELRKGADHQSIPDEKRPAFAPGSWISFISNNFQSQTPNKPVPLEVEAMARVLLWAARFRPQSFENCSEPLCSLLSFLRACLHSHPRSSTPNQFDSLSSLQLLSDILSSPLVPSVLCLRQKGVHSSAEERLRLLQLLCSISFDEPPGGEGPRHWLQPLSERFAEVAGLFVSPHSIPSIHLGMRSDLGDEGGEEEGKNQSDWEERREVIRQWVSHCRPHFLKALLSESRTSKQINGKGESRRGRRERLHLLLGTLSSLAKPFPLPNNSLSSSVSSAAPSLPPLPSTLLHSLTQPQTQSLISAQPVGPGEEAALLVSPLMAVLGHSYDSWRKKILTFSVSRLLYLRSTLSDEGEDEEGGGDEVEVGPESIQFTLSNLDFDEGDKERVSDGKDWDEGWAGGWGSRLATQGLSIWSSFLLSGEQLTVHRALLTQQLISEAKLHGQTEGGGGGAPKQAPSHSSFSSSSSDHFQDISQLSSVLFQVLEAEGHRLGCRAVDNEADIQEIYASSVCICIQLLRISAFSANELITSRWKDLSFALLGPSPPSEDEDQDQLKTGSSLVSAETRKKWKEALCSVLLTCKVHPRVLALPCYLVSGFEDLEADGEAWLRAQLEAALGVAIRRLRKTHDSILTKIATITSSPHYLAIQISNTTPPHSPSAHTSIANHHPEEGNKKAKQRATQREVERLTLLSSETLPENVLPYAVYLLSYHPDFPSNPNLSSDVEKRRCLPIVRGLKMLLRVLLETPNPSQTQTQQAPLPQNLSYLMEQFRLLTQSYLDKEEPQNNGIVFISHIGLELLKAAIRTDEDLQPVQTGPSMPPELFLTRLGEGGRGLGKEAVRALDSLLSKIGKGLGKGAALKTSLGGGPLVSPGPKKSKPRASLSLSSPSRRISASPKKEKRKSLRSEEEEEEGEEWSPLAASSPQPLRSQSLSPISPEVPTSSRPSRRAKEAVVKYLESEEEEDEEEEEEEEEEEKPKAQIKKIKSDEPEGKKEKEKGSEGRTSLLGWLGKDEVKGNSNGKKSQQGEKKEVKGMKETGKRKSGDSVNEKPNKQKGNQENKRERPNAKVQHSKN